MAEEEEKAKKVQAKADKRTQKKAEMKLKREEKTKRKVGDYVYIFMSAQMHLYECRVIQFVNERQPVFHTGTPVTLTQDICYSRAQGTILYLEYLLPLYYTGCPGIKGDRSLECSRALNIQHTAIIIS